MDRDAEIERILAEYLESVGVGTVSQVAELITHHPEYQAELTEFFALRHDFETIVFPPRRLGGPPPHVPHSFPLPLGRYTLLSKLGAGGMGIVYRARLNDPARAVALKMIRAGRFASPEDRIRFRTEVDAQSRLSHPAIVPVYDVGEAEGQQFYTMKLLEGGDLTRRQPQLGGAPVEAARVIRELARAVHHAHLNGVLHRDLKPSNILFDEADRPHISDFGLAKVVGRSADLTQTGEIVGTLPYASPEQLDGAPITVASDVYGLGCLLYFALTGRPPFDGLTPESVLDRLRNDDPVSPRRTNPRVPRDLVAICTKCLEKDPARRYPDAEALAADLGRFLAAQPTLARPMRRTERARMWVRRNPVVAALTGLATVSLLLLAAGGWMYHRDLAENNLALLSSLDRERAAAADADRQRELAIDRFRILRRHVYLAEIREAAALADRGALTDRSVRAWDPEYGEDLRGFEWRYLTRLARPTRTWADHHGPVNLGRITDDGRWGVTVAGREVRIWEVGTGRVAAEWTHTSGLNHLAAVSADGRFAAAVPATREDGVLLFTQGNSVPRLVEKTRGLHAWLVEFAANNHLLVLVAGPRVGPSIQVYDVPAGTLVRSFALDEHSVLGIGVGAGGRTAAVIFERPPGNTPAPAVMYDVSSGRELGRWAAPVGAGPMALSADGRYVLFTAELRKDVQIWDVAGQKVQAEFPFPTGEPVKTIDRLSHGRLAAVTWPDAARGVREIMFAIWDPRDNRWAIRRLVTPCLVNSVRFRPDGRGLLVGGTDSTVHMVDVDRPAPESGWPVTGKHEAWAVAVSPDGRTIVTGGDDHSVRLWDARTGACLAARTDPRTDHRSLVTTAAFAPEGSWAATGSFDGRVIIWDARIAAPLRALVHGPKVRTLAISPDGRAVAAAGDTGAVSVWDVETGQLRYRLNGAGTVVHAVLFTADGKALLATPGETELVWWDAATGRRLHGVDLRLRPSCLTLSPDGKILAVGYETGQVELLDAATGREHSGFCGPYSRLNALAFSPDGKTLAAAAVDGSVRLWQTATGTELFAIARGGPQINGVAFAPDGSFLTATRHDGRLLLWPAVDWSSPDK